MSETTRFIADKRYKAEKHHWECEQCGWKFYSFHIPKDGEYCPHCAKKIAEYVLYEEEVKIETNLRKELKIVKEENGYLKLENKLQTGEIEFLKKRLSIAQNETFINECAIEFKKIIKLLEAKMGTCVVCGDIIPEGRQVCPKCEAKTYGEKEELRNGIKRLTDDFETELEHAYKHVTPYSAFRYCAGRLRELLK